MWKKEELVLCHRRIDVFLRDKPREEAVNTQPFYRIYSHGKICWRRFSPEVLPAYNRRKRAICSAACTHDDVVTTLCRNAPKISHYGRVAPSPGTLSFEEENLRDKPRKEAVNTQPFYQDTTKMPQDDRRWVEDATKMPPRCHQDASGRPKMGPRWRREGSLRQSPPGKPRAKVSILLGFWRGEGHPVR